MVTKFRKGFLRAGIRITELSTTFTDLLYNVELATKECLSLLKIYRYVSDTRNKNRC